MEKGHRMMEGEEAVEMSRVKDCKYCSTRIVFIKSRKTGNFYPVNYHGEISKSGNALVSRRDIHKCPSRPPICRPGEERP